MTACQGTSFTPELTTTGYALFRAGLAAGSGISEPACWRDIREGISLAGVARLAVKMGWDYVIADGVHVPAVTFGRKTGGQGRSAPASASGTG